MSEKILFCNLNGCKHHPGLPLKNVYNIIFQGEPEPQRITFGAGAQFVVSKELILKRPKSFYEKVLKLHEHRILPWVIERFYTLIFKTTC